MSSVTKDVNTPPTIGAAYTRRAKTGTASRLELLIACRINHTLAALSTSSSTPGEIQKALSAPVPYSRRTI